MLLRGFILVGKPPIGALLPPTDRSVDPDSHSVLNNTSRSSVELLFLLNNEIAFKIQVFLSLVFARQVDF